MGRKRARAVPGREELPVASCQWPVAGREELPVASCRGQKRLEAIRPPATGNRPLATGNYFVIQTSFENAFSFGSFAFASASEAHFTRTRKIGPFSLAVRST